MIYSIVAFHTLDIGQFYYPRIYSSMGQAHSLISVLEVAYCVFPNKSNDTAISSMGNYDELSTCYPSTLCRNQHICLLMMVTRGGGGNS